VAPLIEIDRVVKRYQALRPLRIAQLRVARTDRIALFGLDEAAAEMFVHLVTGASLADEGDIRVAGRNTRDIRSDAEWLSSLDRFGIVTHRAVLIEAMSIGANLALPMTLSVDPMPDEIRRTVEALAVEVELPGERLDRPAGSLSPAERVRVHLARALALEPASVLLEHPTAGLDPSAAAAFGEVLRRASARRDVGWVALTADQAFARASGGVAWHLTPASGEIAAARRRWPWSRS
jgi:ABC-type transporter Mla maintaining outer membrane lipid asymmetry ATPase subunit MlaF